MKKFLFVLFLLLPVILYSNPLIIEIYFNKSTDSGVSWVDSVGIPVVALEVHDYPPALDVRSSNIFYTIWASSFPWSDTTHSYIYSTNSTDGGNYWWEYGRLVDDSTWSLKISPVLITDIIGTAYAVWEDSRSDSMDVYFAKSTDEGNTWTNPNIKVSDSSVATRKFPSITVDTMSNLYIVWQDNRSGRWDIYFTKSTDGGLNWQHPDFSISDSLEGDHFEPKLKMKNNILYLVWRSSIVDTSHLYFGKSTDYGVTWLKTIISDVDTLERGLPSMDVMDSLIGVTWQDGRSGESHIYFSGSVDGGLNWSDDIMVDDGTGGGKYHPSVGIDEWGALYAAWDDERNGHSQIYFAKSVDAGSTWTSPSMLIGVSGQGEDIMPSLAINSQEICVAWQLEGIIISGVEESAFSSSTFSLNVYPNPASQSVDIYYTLQREEKISIDIYDISGRLLKEISSGLKGRGTHIIYWDRKDSSGRDVKSGIYFLRIKTPNRTINKKLVLL
ncbi:MAG: T9SS type A sorting domain-containing protein [Candidatus Cloacimonadota bacterium]|nr:MAG: T9SS type A sorting domain-containing protein [Candidatus Cloacimonadota bacterium]